MNYGNLIQNYMRNKKKQKKLVISKFIRICVSFFLLNRFQIYHDKIFHIKKF